MTLRIKDNHGQSLHVWQLDFSAHNNTGNRLSFLKAEFDIASPWPPCTEWRGEGPGGGPSGNFVDAVGRPAPIEWADTQIALSMPNGMGKSGLRWASPSVRLNPWSATCSCGDGTPIDLRKPWICLTGPKPKRRGMRELSGGGRYPGGAVTDPVSTRTGRGRVARGGSWSDYERIVGQAWKGCLREQGKRQ